MTGAVSTVGKAFGVGGGGGPAPQPVPVGPSDEEMRRRREEAARAAILDAKSRGRASTVAAGESEALASQYERGLLKVEQRARVSREVLG